MPPPNIAVTPQEWQTIQHLLEQHVPHLEVWAFGSRARGTPKPYSDLDLALISDQPVGLPTLAALAESFSESDIPYKVDLVDWAMASASFRPIIEQGKVVIRHPTGGRL